MSDNRRNATLKALIDAAITELMIKTSGEQIYLDDNTTLSSKMAEMVTAINLRDKKTDVDAKIKTVTDSLTSTSESLSNDISTLRFEKADTSHTHDDRYYTKAETDTAIADAPKGDTGVWISQADYDALSDEDKALDLNYYIYDAKSNSGSDSSGISISQAEYDALSAEEKASEATYYIYDANSNPNAASIPFTSENYTATNVGAALEEVNGKLNSSLENQIVIQNYSISCTLGSNPYYGDISVKKDGYTAFSATIETPVVGIDHMQSCGFRGTNTLIYGQSDVSGTMRVKVAYIKN